MQFSLNIMHSHIRLHLPRLVGAAMALSMASMAHAASPESVYIQQAAPGASAKPTAVSAPVPSSQPTSFARSDAQLSLTPPPEQVVPRNAAAANSAQTLEIGNNNGVAQLQAGHNDRSSVSVIGGSGNNVGVLQGGNDRSNIVMLGTQGMNISVLQPANSAPINMLIARLPNGSIYIK
jgi:hypothetical protein